MPTCPHCGSTDVITLRTYTQGSWYGCRHCNRPWKMAHTMPNEPPKEIDRVQGKVLGFRAWMLSGGLLGSVAQSGGWTVTEGLHRAPAHDCPCGLYAMYEPPVYGPEYVYGAVLAWGRIEVHLVGFRAQYAELVMLAYSDEQAHGLVVRVQALASEMGIECVQLSELKERARKLGEPIAPELRPPWLPLPPGAYIGPSGHASAGYLPRSGSTPGATAMAPYYPPHRRRPP